MANPYEEKIEVTEPAGKAGEGTSGEKEPIKGIGNASGASIAKEVSSTDRCTTAETIDCIKSWTPPHRR